MATKVKLSKKLSDLFLTRDQARAITKKTRPDLVHAEDHPSIRYFLAVNLTQARKKRGLTQGELAKKAKLSLRTVQGLEAAEGPNSPTLDTVDAVALALHMKISELLKTWEETEVFV